MRRPFPLEDAPDGVLGNERASNKTNLDSAARLPGAITVLEPAPQTHNFSCGTDVAWPGKALQRLPNLPCDRL